MGDRMSNPISRHGAIAAGHPETVAAGIQVLENGGNVWDAALACMAAACVVEPVLSSLGGGGFMLVQDRSSGTRPVLYDFFAQTPGKLRRANETDFFPVTVDFGTAQQEFHIGTGACAVPGMVPGMYTIHRDLCSMPLSAILKPAIDIARKGAVVNDFQAFLFGVVRPIYDRNVESLSTYGSVENGLAVSGDILRNLDLAEVLETMGNTSNADNFLSEFNNSIVRFMEENGGHIRGPDVDGYIVEKREPLKAVIDSARIVTNSPPSTGGILIAFALSLLHQQAVSKGLSNAMLARIMTATNGARLESGLGKLDEMAFDRLLDQKLVERYRREVSASPKSHRGTTHISVIDGTGNTAAVTLSNGEGCGKILPGMGFMLNNMLGEEDINPLGFGGWATNVRLSSMMAPTFIEHDESGLTVLGSGGSNRIRTAILQVICNLVRHDMVLEDAIVAPRLHMENGNLSIEGGFSEQEINHLKSEFDSVSVWPERNMFFGGVHGVQLSHNGELTAFGDPRRGGFSRVTK